MNDVNNDQIRERIEACAPKLRWWQRRDHLFTVEYWDDTRTHTAISTAAELAATTGNVWMYRTNRRDGIYLLNPAGSFAVALFEMFEHVTGYDVGGLGVDIDIDTVTVTGIAHPQDSDKRTEHVNNTVCTLYRYTLANTAGEPIGADVLAYTQRFVPHPPYGNLTDIGRYTYTFEQWAQALADVGWACRHNELRARSTGDTQLEAWLDDIYAHTTAHTGLDTIELAEIAAGRATRIATIADVAATHGLDTAHINELVGDTVPTDAIGDIIAATRTA